MQGRDRYKVQRETLGAVSVCRHHVPSSLCHSSAVLFSGAVEPAIRPGHVEREHPLHVLKDIVKESTPSEGVLELSPMAVVGLPLVGLKVVLEVAPLLLLLGVLMELVVLSKRVKVSEQVVEVEAEGLVEMLAGTSPPRALERRVTSHLIVLTSPLVIR